MNGGPSGQDQQSGIDHVLDALTAMSALWVQYFPPDGTPRPTAKGLPVPAWAIELHALTGIAMSDLTAALRETERGPRLGIDPAWPNMQTARKIRAVTAICAMCALVEGPGHRPGGVPLTEPRTLCLDLEVPIKDFRHSLDRHQGAAGFVITEGPVTYLRLATARSGGMTRLTEPAVDLCIDAVDAVLSRAVPPGRELRRER